MPLLERRTTFRSNLLSDYFHSFRLSQYICSLGNTLFYNSYRLCIHSAHINSGKSAVRCGAQGVRPSWAVLAMAWTFLFVGAVSISPMGGKGVRPPPEGPSAVLSWLHHHAFGAKSPPSPPGPSLALDPLLSKLPSGLPPPPPPPLPRRRLPNSPPPLPVSVPGASSALKLLMGASKASSGRAEVERRGNESREESGHEGGIESGREGVDERQAHTWIATVLVSVFLLLVLLSAPAILDMWRGRGHDARYARVAAPPEV